MLSNGHSFILLDCLFDVAITNAVSRNVSSSILCKWIWNSGTQYNSSKCLVNCHCMCIPRIHTGNTNGKFTMNQFNIHQFASTMWNTTTENKINRKWLAYSLHVVQYIFDWTYWLRGLSESDACSYLKCLLFKQNDSIIIEVKIPRSKSRCLAWIRQNLLFE